tara:strand:- start:962 stop:1546 length:585 start_codon:yes stop_codon:yes gene_type:complete
MNKFWAVYKEVVAAAAVLLIFFGIFSCEKEDNDNPTSIPKHVLRELNSTNLEAPSLMAVLSVADRHFYIEGPNNVNTTTTYFRESGVWYDMSHPKMKYRFNGLYWRISSTDCTWTKIQSNAAEDYGKMVFCVSADDYENGGCDFIQPCTSFRFEFSVSPLSGFPPELIDKETHICTTRVAESVETPALQGGCGN